MKLIGQLVNKLVKDLELEKDIKLLELLDKWPQIIENNLDQDCWPIKVKRGKLIIGVENSMVMTELTLRKAEIMAKLSATNYGQELKGILFKLKPERKSDD